MPKLLHAGFARLRKNLVFWLLLLLMPIGGIYGAINCYLQMKKFALHCTLDSLFFQYTMFIGVFLAIFCSLFLGAEYSDGTMRNKLVIGHARSSIYLSSLIFSTVAGLLFCLAYILAYLAVGVPLLGSFELMDSTTVVTLLFCTVFLVIAYASIFTMLAILIRYKAVTAVVTMIGAVLLLLLAAYLYGRLAEPPFYTDYIFDASGAVVQGEQIANSLYLSGAKRTAYELFLSFLPSGQAFFIRGGEGSLLSFSLYDTCITILTTVIGMLGFSKKDIN